MEQTATFRSLVSSLVKLIIASFLNKVADLADRAVSRLNASVIVALSDFGQADADEVEIAFRQIVRDFDVVADIEPLTVEGERNVDPEQP